MRVVAYCAREYVGAVRRASGVEPLTSPPVDEASFDVRVLTGCDLFYVGLHGHEWLAEWLGDDGEIALSADQLREADLTGSIVFAESCWLPESPMLGALLGAGAEAVVGGSAKNFGGRERPTGVTLLGWLFRVGLQWGLSPELALALAKAGACLASPNRRDLLGFKVYR